MLRFGLLQLVGLSLVFTLACVKSEITSFTDPDFHKQVYRHVAVWANFKELEDRQFVENAYRDELRKKPVHVSRFLDVFPPTRTVNPDDFRMLLREKNVDAVLVIRLVRVGADVTEVKRGYWEPDFWDDSATYTETTQYLKEPYAGFEVKLLDVESGRLAWTSKVNSKGETIHTIYDVVEGAAAKVVDDLERKGLIPKPVQHKTTPAVYQKPAPPVQPASSR